MEEGRGRRSWRRVGEEVMEEGRGRRSWRRVGGGGHGGG